jgi:hypothetical protein
MMLFFFVHFLVLVFFPRNLFAHTMSLTSKEFFIAGLLEQNMKKNQKKNRAISQNDTTNSGKSENNLNTI